jgi:hypothetical protein
VEKEAEVPGDLVNDGFICGRVGGNHDQTQTRLVSLFSARDRCV